MWRFGAEYEPERIIDRLRQRGSIEKIRCQQSVLGYQNCCETHLSPQKSFRGDFQKTGKITGIQAQYLHYCYLLGKFPKRKNRRPLSPEMREAWRWIDKISDEVRLIGRENLGDLAAVESFAASTKSDMETVTAQRTKLYNQLRRCTDPVRITEVKSKRDDCTAVLKELRKDLKTAQGILERNPKMKEQIAIEEKMRQELRPPQRRKNRSRERVR